MLHVTLGGGKYSVLKMFLLSMTELINELINYKTVRRTAPASPHLLKIEDGFIRSVVKHVVIT